MVYSLLYAQSFDRGLRAIQEGAANNQVQTSKSRRDNSLQVSILLIFHVDSTTKLTHPPPKSTDHVNSEDHVDSQYMDFEHRFILLQASLQSAHWNSRSSASTDRGKYVSLSSCCINWRNLPVPSLLLPKPKCHLKVRLLIMFLSSCLSHPAGTAVKVCRFWQFL